MKKLCFLFLNLFSLWCICHAQNPSDDQPSYFQKGDWYVGGNARINGLLTRFQLRQPVTRADSSTNMSQELGLQANGQYIFRENKAFIFQLTGAHSRTWTMRSAQRLVDFSVGGRAGYRQYFPVRVWDQAAFFYQSVFSASFARQVFKDRNQPANPSGNRRTEIGVSIEGGISINPHPKIQIIALIGSLRYQFREQAFLTRALPGNWTQSINGNFSLANMAFGVNFRL